MSTLPLASKQVAFRKKKETDTKACESVESSDPAFFERRAG